MTECLIKVERDSVCMGDDIDAPHSYSFKVQADSSIADVFAHLAEKNYLASVAGKNHSWEALADRKMLALVLGNNQLPQESTLLAMKISDFEIEGVLNLRFKYNSATT